MSGLEQVHLVGGENGGMTMEWDVAKSGPVIHTVVYPQSPLNYKSFTRVEDTETLVYDNEVFKVEKMHFGNEGHIMYFGILDGMSMAMAIKELWDVYADMKQAVI